MSEVFPLRFQRSTTLSTLNLSKTFIIDKCTFARMNARHGDDNKYVSSSKVKQREYVPVISREPSFTKFKVPFEMICQKRYSQHRKMYEQQFLSEMRNLIDNQSSAKEATYFVRIISYTTLWPPYHNENELYETSRKFYKLTPKEQTRFNNIMMNDFSYI